MSAMSVGIPPKNRGSHRKHAGDLIKAVNSAFDGLAEQACSLGQAVLGLGDGLQRARS